MEQKSVLKENIKILLEKYKFTIESLSKITQVDSTWLRNYMDGNSSKSDIDMLKYILFSDTIFMLSKGIDSVDNDSRVKGIIDVLLSEFKLKLETLSIYTGIELKNIENFMKDPQSIACEEKYKLAVVTIFLHFCFSYKFKIPSNLE